MPIMGIGQAMVDIVLGTGQFEGMAAEGPYSRAAFSRLSSGSLGVGRGWLKRSHNVRRDLEGPQTCVMVVDLAIEDDLVRLIAR
jgi:hypothetical protein